jgi:hypothetical protein
LPPKFYPKKSSIKKIINKKSSIMKNKFLLSISVLAIAASVCICVLALFAGLSSCGGKDNQSAACEIISFKVGDKPWDVSGTNISATYPKGTNVGSLAPVIEVSNKASVSPKSGAAQDFSNDKAVTYTVTAENGKTKTYTARATVATQ